jgi:hypothetical protein
MVLYQNNRKSNEVNKSKSCLTYMKFRVSVFKYFIINNKNTFLSVPYKCEFIKISN